ncbi:MAG TPA: anhydro-N-acetylmuramic acid kinase [Thermoanaerobaculia bacterium]|nr:anhydro-N-acetylmuramic acid kinase [Thermoanaerobaculia bacterium]
MNRVERLIEIARKKKRVVIGLMSGTSVDAIDAVLVRIEGNARDGARIEKLRFRSFGFPQEIQTRIKLLFERERDRKLTDPVTGEHPAPWTIEEICHLDFVLGELFAQAANRLIADAGMKNDDVDLIAAAGQTIWHRPRPTTEPSTASLPWLDEPITTRSTLAIGQAAVIAERTGIITMGDLRVRDVAAGGHGAPLVAYFDWGQLRHPKLARAMQNIGGIANVTFIPPNAKLDDVVAFDTGPGNMVIDSLMYLVTKGTETFDRDGERAARGVVRDDVLAWCMSDPYFQLKPPKTTGRERFGRQFAARMAERFQDVAPDDLLATATAFTAESIAHAYREFIGSHVDEMIVAGGGAKNPALLRMLRERLPDTEIRVYEFLQEKEAMAMALIASDSISGLDTNVASVTGGHSTILGKICL